MTTPENPPVKNPEQPVGGPEKNTSDALEEGELDSLISETKGEIKAVSSEAEKTSKTIGEVGKDLAISPVNDPQKQDLEAKFADLSARLDAILAGINKVEEKPVPAVKPAEESKKDEHKDSHEKSDKKDDHKDTHGKDDKKDDHGGEHGHDHGPKAPKLKGLPFPDWKEVKSGKSPILDIKSSVFELILKSKEGKEPSGFGKNLLEVYSLLAKGEPGADEKFKHLFDNFSDSNAEFLQALQENGINLTEFKKAWTGEGEKSGLYKDVFKIVSQAALVDQATERQAHASREDRKGEVIGYGKKIATRAAIYALGAGVGMGSANSLGWANEARGALIMSSGSLASRWLGSMWGDAAKKIQDIGEDDIKEGKETATKQQTERLLADLEKDPAYLDYKRRSLAQWLSQSIREVSVKKYAADDKNPAHLNPADDPNLYLLRIEAAKALKNEYHNEGDLEKERIATLDKYIHQLNQNRFNADLIYKDRVEKAYKDGGKANKGKLSAAKDKIDSGFLWAHSKSDSLRKKGHVLSWAMGAVAGVALWGASLSYKRTLMIGTGAVLGGEAGAHLDAKATKEKLETEVSESLAEIKKLVTESKDPSQVDFKKIMEIDSKLQAAVNIGVLSNNLKLEVQDTLHNIRNGVFFEGSGKQREFKLEVFVKTTEGAGKIAEAEVKRLAAPAKGIRKYLGFLGGGAAGFLFGKIW